MRREKEGLTNIELIQNGCVFYSPHRNVTERYVYIYASAEWNTLVTIDFFDAGDEQIQIRRDVNLNSSYNLHAIIMQAFLNSK